MYLRFGLTQVGEINSGTTKYCLSNTANAMPADALVTFGASASAARHGIDPQSAASEELTVGTNEESLPITVEYEWGIPIAHQGSNQQQIAC